MKACMLLRCEFLLPNCRSGRRNLQKDYAEILWPKMHLMLMRGNYSSRPFWLRIHTPDKLNDAQPTVVVNQRLKAIDNIMNAK